MLMDLPYMYCIRNVLHMDHDLVYSYYSMRLTERGTIWTTSRFNGRLREARREERRGHVHML